MMSTRESFVETFGEEQAQAVEAAAENHKNGVHDYQGSDPFRWAVAIVIGYECVSSTSYAEYHGITVPQDEFKAWVRDHGDLGHHDGDADYLSVFTGVYNEYISAFDEAVS